jgi:predicted DsbA family dithiol-disulfide isomerase
VRVERLRSLYAIDIVHRHFPLHPETPDAGLTLEELFAGRDFDLAAAQARMKRLMAAEGLPYGERTMTYNSRLAQELAKWAETQPGGARIHDALFRAYFVDSVNLADPHNLVRIAAEIGLPAAEAESVLSTRQFRGTVDADWQRSRDLGITGVPTFVVGSRGLVGAQPFEELEGLVRAAGAVRRTL